MRSRPVAPSGFSAATACSRPDPGRVSGSAAGLTTVADGKPPRLLDRVRDSIRTRHYSPQTEKAYVQWIRRFILFHGKRHPEQMGAAEIGAFLTHLAVKEGVSASTQNQALAAILFLYQMVLDREVGWVTDVVSAKRPQRLPVVLSRAEVAGLLRGLAGAPYLVASVLYGAGLRLLEALTLRVKDIDFDRREITVRDGKGRKDRITMLPDALLVPLRQHLACVLAQHEVDINAGAGFVALPDALRQKYPSAPREWRWQWVFPATRHYKDMATGEVRRHHLHETVI